MPIINRIANFAEDMNQWRQELHSNPELKFDCYETASFIVERLKEFGINEIHTGIAKTGIVAIINGKKDGETIGLRADMDALPLQEIKDHPYKSKKDGIMHACGHDGHMTMLLGAAKYLNETKNFSGKVALIFQPSEEDGGGGRVMCEEGIMDTFSINQVYGLHNAPGLPLGFFKTNPGPNMAAADDFTIEIKGKGGQEQIQKKHLTLLQHPYKLHNLYKQLVQGTYLHWIMLLYRLHRYTLGQLIILYLKKHLLTVQ